jgi:hypothetical protein
MIRSLIARGNDLEAGGCVPAPAAPKMIINRTRSKDIDGEIFRRRR